MSAAALAKYVGQQRAEESLVILDDAEHAKLLMMASEATGAGALIVPPLDDLAAHKVQEGLARLRVVQKEVEAMRRARLQPLEAEVKAINGVLKRFTDQVADVCRRAEGFLVGWKQHKDQQRRMEQEAARRKQEEAAQAQLEAEIRATNAVSAIEREAALKDAEAASLALMTAQVEEPPAPPRAMRGETGSTAFRKVWKVEVIDESLVPREYLSVDEGKLRKAVAAGVRVIEGCNVFEADVPVTRVAR